MPKCTNASTASLSIPNWLPYQPSDTLSNFTFSKKNHPESILVCQIVKYCKKCHFKIKICLEMLFWGGWIKSSRQLRSDTKHKTFNNYQMSHYVLQENHKGNSKKYDNLTKNFFYFLSVFMKDPVAQVRKGYPLIYFPRLC